MIHQEREDIDLVLNRLTHKVCSTLITEENKAEKYKELLATTVYDISVYGILSELNGNIDDLMAEEYPLVVEGLDVIVQNLSLLFKKPYRDVETDMMKQFDQFPIEDFKVAFFLKQNNMLQ